MTQCVHPVWTVAHHIWGPSTRLILEVMAREHWSLLTLFKRSGAPYAPINRGSTSFPGWVGRRPRVAQPLAKHTGSYPKVRSWCRWARSGSFPPRLTPPAFPCQHSPANPPSRVIGQKHLSLPAGRNGPRKGTPVAILKDQYLVYRRLIILANP